jgi:hypothetical protein
LAQLNYFRFVHECHVIPLYRENERHVHALLQVFDSSRRKLEKQRREARRLGLRHPSAKIPRRKRTAFLAPDCARFIEADPVGKEARSAVVD